MNYEVVVSCAVTGAGDTVGRHPGVPVTPEQIADAAIEAARAGAAIAHIHVRDPETGRGSRDPALFRDVVERVRASDTDVVINLTSGMGGDWVPSADDPAMPGPGTDMVGPVERLAHVAELRPEICSIDCGTMNFGNGDEIYISTPACLRRMAEMVRDWDVKARARSVRARADPVRPPDDRGGPSSRTRRCSRSVSASPGAPTTASTP